METLAPNPPPQVSALGAVLEEIARAASDFSRRREEISLVCVSKTVEAERIAPVLRAGQRLFGENRVQEAHAKWPALRAAFPDVELHLIGPLQSNKAAEAVALFDVVESVDRPRIVDALAAEMARQNRRPRCFVQVNIGEEPQKAGAAPAQTGELLDYCAQKGLAVEGLMCIPPAGRLASPYFARLAMLAREFGLARLSMGMSGDFREAIQLGATHVRVGSAIFGDRIQSPAV